jgi:hypothetical protein
MKSFMAAVAIVLLTTSIVSATGFEKGNTYIGPTVGLAFGGAGIGFNGERAIDKNWAAGGEISYSGFTDNISTIGYSAKWKYTFIGVLAFGAYHFQIKDKPQYDPYLKAGLGYFHWSAKYSDSNGNYYENLYSAGYSSGIGFTGAAGGRYFFKPSMAVRAQIGYPFYIGIGLDFIK